MPALQNLVLTDRQATPVNHTFIPWSKTADGTGTVVESTGLQIGNNVASIQVKKLGKRYKNEFRLTIPIVVNQVINGVTTPTVARTSYVSLKFDFDESSSEQERKDAVGMAYSALDPAKILVNDSIVKLQGLS